MTGCKVVVFISGRGSNFRSLHEHRNGYEIAGVVSDNSNAPGLDYAEQVGATTHVIERKSFSSRSEYGEALLKLTTGLKPDLIALAGFMQIIGVAFIERFYGRIINIHPALLPKYPGLHTHERALADGESEHGCTVHFVDQGVDTGPIIAQAALKCTPGEDVESLAARVLALEHRIYPWVVRQLAGGGVLLQDRARVTFNESARNEALQLGFRLACADTGRN